MTAAIRELTFKQEPHMVLRRQAKLSGMRTLFQDGLSKAISGLTTLEEVVDVAGIDEE
ncbi:MAG: hypothetical protein U1D30_25155 [Planctomycetota bacterium]